MEKSKVLRALGNLALIVASLMVVLLLFEGAFRILPVERGPLSAEETWRAREGSSWIEEEGAQTRVGDVWFWEEEISPRILEPDHLRLLFLGDSFTVGAGLPRRSDRFTDIIEAALNADQEELGDKRKIDVFNASKEGTYPGHWARYLDDLIPAYRPHAVITVFFLRDGTFLPTSLMLNKRHIEPIREKYLEKPLYGRSALVTFFWNRLAWQDYTELFKRMLKSAYLGTPRERAMWTFQQKRLVEMASRCQREKIPFHLVIFPMLFDLEHYDFLDVEGEIRKFAEGQGIPVFSLTPGFLGKADHRLWLSSNDQHPNEEGHGIAAETLLPYLRSAVLGLEDAI